MELTPRRGRVSAITAQVLLEKMKTYEPGFSVPEETYKMARQLYAGVTPEEVAVDKGRTGNIAQTFCEKTITHLEQDIAQHSAVIKSRFSGLGLANERRQVRVKREYLRRMNRLKPAALARVVTGIIEAATRETTLA